ncbi:hypothetical protein FQN60_014355 [Etheostoma spectabile]|uniref:Uncharacterized protein n=1 Tax=Etheostoma spectabile TaxID=54343 RepID=A0A5J5DDI4_9PERO|nr:hypothetical protein FQN60_014355 [Etheostoma spectabile]
MIRRLGQVTACTTTRRPCIQYLQRQERVARQRSQCRSNASNSSHDPDVVRSRKERGQLTGVSRGRHLLLASHRSSAYRAQSASFIYWWRLFSERSLLHQTKSLITESFAARPLRACDILVNRNQAFPCEGRCCKNTCAELTTRSVFHGVEVQRNNF